MSQPITVFLLDNFDSFTYNLVDELRGLGHELVIYRNIVNAEKIFSEMQDKAQTSHVLLMLSPGPGAPVSAGCMLELLDKVRGHFPVLGICLGHQAIIEYYGGEIVRAAKVMHGKSSAIDTLPHRLFEGLPKPLPVARYHSLVAGSTPKQLDIIATFDGIPMAVCHEPDSMVGFQFHPESILSANGSQLLNQTIHYLTERN